MHFNITESKPGRLSADSSIEPRRRGARSAGCPTHQTTSDRASVLSWRMLRPEGNPMIYLPVIGQDHINRMETEARVSMLRCERAARLRERSMKRRWWRQQKLRVFVRDRFTCQYCYRVFSNDLDLLTVDHIRPKIEGGTNEMDNLITACLSCNLIKGGVAVQDVHDAREVVLASRVRLREWVAEELEGIGHELAMRHPK